MAVSVRDAESGEVPAGEGGGWEFRAAEGERGEAVLACGEGDGVWVCGHVYRVYSDWELCGHGHRGGRIAGSAAERVQGSHKEN